MALEAVVGEIRQKGQEKVARIQSETKQEVQEILAAAQAEVASIKLAAEEEVERQIGSIMIQEVAAAKLATKREILNAQKELLDEVFSTTGAAIAALPADFHRKAIRELLKRASREIPSGVAFCNERDVPVLEKALSDLKTLSSLSSGGTVEIDGGIIVESGDGELQLDYSYRTFLEEVWETGLKDASDILFG